MADSDVQLGDPRPVERMRRLWLDFEHGRDPISRRLSWIALRRLASGDPLPLPQARQELGLPEAEFDALVDRLVEQGHLTVDEGRTAITGAWGLSVVPSRHVLVLDGRRLSTWCAFDAVGIPAALGADARVESRCADTGAAVWLDIERGRLARASHDDLRISFVPPDTSRPLCANTCAAMSFSCSPGYPIPDDAVLMSVEEAMSLGREFWAEPMP